MPRPTVAAVTDEWYASLGRATDDDEGVGWQQLVYLDSIGRLVQVIETIVRDDDAGNPGWSVIMDIDNAPPGVIAWLSQFVGVTTNPALDDAGNRQRAKATAGFRRGTPAATIAAAQQYMTGTKSVTVFEREGSPYRYRVRVFTAEVTDTAALTAAVEEMKPAGLVLTVEIAAGLSYDELGSRYADSDAMSATLMTYEQLAELV